MFAACPEMSISAIAKHVQHIGTIRVFYLPEGGWFVKLLVSAWRRKRLMGCHLLVGISAQDETMGSCLNVTCFSLQPFF